MNLSFKIIELVLSARSIYVFFHTFCYLIYINLIGKVLIFNGVRDFLNETGFSTNKHFISQYTSFDVPSIF